MVYYEWEKSYVFNEDGTFQLLNKEETLACMLGVNRSRNLVT